VTALLDYARAGDTVVVVALDRLGRSLSSVIRTIETLSSAGVLLRSCALEDLKRTVAAARWRAQRVANTELVQLYWQLGDAVPRRQWSEGWGTRVIDRLAPTCTRRSPTCAGCPFSELAGVAACCAGRPVDRLTGVRPNTVQLSLRRCGLAACLVRDG